MSDSGATLPDMLAMVPALLKTCTPRAFDTSMAVALRLVCKELSVTMTRVMWRCTVQLGEGACPTIGQVVRVMQLAKLRLLTVTVSTTSGRNSPAVAQQLATCSSQMAELVVGMGGAMQGASSLTIIFQHQHTSSSSRSHATSITSTATTSSSTASNMPEAPLTAGCPACFAVVTRTVCTMLAAALPSLRSLSLKGPCKDPAFAAFGASCPQLADLTVQAFSLPIKALKDISTHLPKLSSFVLTSPTSPRNSTQLTKYVQASLCFLQSSVLITTVNICFEKGEVLICKPGDWLQVPPNLTDIYCSCEINGIQNAAALLSSLRTLCIQRTPSFRQLREILTSAPHLQECSTLTRSLVIRCDPEEITPSITLLRERIHNGLRLYVPFLHIVEGDADMAAVLATLPILRQVRSCVLQFDSAIVPHSLIHVARIFPEIRVLTLVVEDPMMHTPEMVVEFLGPLVACSTLRKLKILFPMKLETTDLVGLCLKMPSLEALLFVKRKGVVVSDLMSALASHGRVLDIQEM